MTAKNDPLDRARLYLAIVITVMWAASITLDFFVQEYEVPATLHGLMMLVAGFLYGPSIIRRAKEEDK